MPLKRFTWHFLRNTSNAALTCRLPALVSHRPTFTRRYSNSPPDTKPSIRKTAIITGASGGIGSAIAHRFAKEGHSCILIGRNTSTLETVLRGLDTRRTAISPRHHRIEIGDVGSEDFWTSLSKSLKSNNESCSVLVNAAGLTHASLLVRTQKETIDKILNTNLTGTILGCKAMLKGSMLPRKKGVIVNVASLLAVRGGRGAAVYAASKAGMVGLTRALVAETAGTGIRINCILPGYINTAMTTQGFSDAYRDELAESIPAKRFGTAEEVADAAWFLVNNEYANNCTLNLDGGLSAV